MRRATIVTFSTTFFVLALCQTARGQPAFRHQANQSGDFDLRAGDVVVFAGGTNMVRAGKAGHLETLLTMVTVAARPRFRDLSWEGDTVFHQGTVAERWRKGHLGDWPGQLGRVGATVILTQFGQLEALRGRAGLEEFSRAYHSLLDEFQKRTRRIVLISPTPFEKAAPPLPDLSTRNADLRLYVEAIRDIAKQRGYRFVDVFSSFADSRSGRPRLTSNGMHLTPAAHQVVAQAVAAELGVLPRRDLEELRAAVVEKHRLGYDYWRPANWKCLYGDDGERIFGQAAGEYPSFRDEWKKFPALILAAEERVWTLAEARASRPKESGRSGDER